MKLKLLNFLLVLTFCFSCTAQDEDDTDKIITQRITFNEGLNNAFTDLIFFENQWFLSYRESDRHGLGKDGVVKILNSTDGVKWDLIKEFSIEGLDLRNASFTINKNKLMAYVHASKYVNKNLVAFTDYKSVFNGNTGGWQNLEDVVLDKKIGYTAKITGNEAWPWKITWYKNKAYTFAYGLDGLFDFYKSSDGSNFNITNSAQKLDGDPSETSMKVDSTGTFYAVVRRNSSNGMIGKSTDSGNSWDWFGTIPVVDFGGPEFVFYKDGILVGGRESFKLILSYYNFKTNTYKKLMTIKSSGDCSYPGMVIKDGYLWMSYYSAHGNKIGTSIYLSKINLAKLNLN
ncbi:exo-alpha-sialidase [Flavobacterium sp. IB48]|uniref:exo-alpha-sialidase n=1 Tax=Flavobacterium sp. IB48 TaxID=2779375 RepID=UPI0018E7EF03|nr:exo-alpha-sialidase [Flavobacterium sp. IB48]MBJ2126449.1 exo-alpha-sialidase [Flavobacterium sp. IB48]